MKKYKILINVFLLLIFLMSIYCIVISAEYCNLYWERYILEKEFKIANKIEDNFAVNLYLSNSLKFTFLTVFPAITCILSIVIMVVLNLKIIKAHGSVFFEPATQKLEAKKQARNEAKALKAEESKQAKIAELQAQLEELKKD